MSRAPAAPPDGIPNALALLRAARSKLSAETWIRYVAAADHNGDGVLATSPEAVRWDAFGAVVAAAGRTTDEGVKRRALDYLNRGVKALDPSCSCLQEWNDEAARDVGDVLRAYDEAIAIARRNG
ncbi:MAG: hypothetical protein ACF8XB_12575 [Planctomycetota bacterium JB042]